jgi:hypothetical protein
MVEALLVCLFEEVTARQGRPSRVCLTVTLAQDEQWNQEPGDAWERTVTLGTQTCWDRMPGICEIGKWLILVRGYHYLIVNQEYLPLPLRLTSFTVSERI